MKRRIAKNLDKRTLSKRNFNKYVYLVFSLQGYWSTSVDSKCYCRTKDGRVMIYSEVLPDGSSRKGKCYYLWHDKKQPSYDEYFN